MLVWLKRLFVGVPKCRLHTWERNEYDAFVCKVCKHTPEVELHVD